MIQVRHIHPTIQPPDGIPIKAHPPEQSGNLGSILGACIAGPTQPEETYATSTVADCFESPRYPVKKLQQANISRVGMTFHVMNSSGHLLRRGIVLTDSPRTYKVALVDPLTGVLSTKRTYAKSATSKWCWFAGVAESNAAYNEHFNVNDDVDDTPSPRLVWEGRKLEHI